MKAKSIIAILAIALLSLAACQKTPVKVFHLTGTTDLEIPCDGGYAMFGIEANENDHWTVAKDVDWLTIEHTFGPGDETSGYDDAVLMFHADRWIMNESRVAKITVTGPGGDYTKTITQFRKALPEKPLSITETLEATAVTTEIELPEGYWVKAENDSAWLTVDKCEEGLLQVSAETNTGEERTATVKILLSDGALLGTVTVTQKSA